MNINSPTLLQSEDSKSEFQLNLAYRMADTDEYWKML